MDAWETHAKYILLNRFNEAYAFSSRYSYCKTPQDSSVAFVALRDVLDYSDKDRFPEAAYGPAQRSNKARIDAILADYAPYGARNEDSEAVASMSGSRYLLNSRGLNDVVWNVIARNYRRHMVQIDANETSVGRWRVGSIAQPYGRFARTFENESGKNRMYFDLNDEFSTESNYTIKVIYFDETEGSTWELRYGSNQGGMRTALEVIGVGDEMWKTVTATVTDAAFANQSERGADLILVNTDEQDDVFHG